MDVSTILGLLLGFGLIAGALWVGGDLQAYFDLPSFLITVGGTVAATIVATPMADLKRLIDVLRAAFGGGEPEPAEAIDTLVRFAEKARREGLLAMEDAAQEIEDRYLRKGIQLIVDGADPEVVRRALVIEMEQADERHASGRRMFERMAGFAPAFGMIGTLIGLIRMLGNLGDPDQIGPGLAVALITTFYGALLAYLVFHPIAGKLKARADREFVARELMLEGLLAIQAGENPRLVAEKLSAFLPPGQREREPEAAPRAGAKREVREDAFGA